MSWFTFLLRQCARPYQRCKYQERRIESIAWTSGRSARSASEANTRRYYFVDGEKIYQDKLAKFIIECEKRSCGEVTARLGQIYTDIFVDECQDLAGWDLDLVEILMGTRIRVLLVGDPRQCTYSTNHAARNSQYRGIGLLALVKKWNRGGLCAEEMLSDNYRCNQVICDWADRLWPELPPSQSMSSNVTGHDGVFVVSPAHVDEYLNRYSPQVLRYDRKTGTSHSAVNFGAAKGRQFDRVLILPHGPLKRYLTDGKPEGVEGSKEKLYVAITRARHSVAFVYNGASRSFHTDGPLGPLRLSVIANPPDTMASILHGFTVYGCPFREPHRGRFH